MHGIASYVSRPAICKAEINTIKQGGSNFSCRLDTKDPEKAKNKNKKLKRNTVLLMSAWFTLTISIASYSFKYCEKYSKCYLYYKGVQYTKTSNDDT